MELPKHLQPTPLPRKKACHQCSQAKARCDHQKPTCTRCQLRGQACSFAERRRLEGSQYPATRVSPANVQTSAVPSMASGTELPLTPSASDALDFSVSPDKRTRSAGIAPSPVQQSGEGPRTSPSAVSELTCTIDASAIECRWLRAFIPDPNLPHKVIPPTINAYIGRVLKSYAGMAIHNNSNTPPFIHPSQLAVQQPLADCYTLLRVCAPHSPLAVQLLEQQMSALYSQHPTFPPAVLLSAFQAYLLYTLTLVFHLASPSPNLCQAIINLQTLASASAAHGTLTRAERTHDRPTSREAWLAGEAKRRTLYTTYILDNYLCAADHLPVFLGTELRGLPAPASAKLWRAGDEAGWRKAYNAHLCDWEEGGGLRIDELWPPPEDMTAEEVGERRRRVDRWLEGVDEFGTMLYALTSGTHGT